ncbi:MAG: hypothetical protein IPO49_18290 [Bacteroidetes bacterium]|nr:hypothetical protein [Bacteroidota bacterium]
MNLINNNPYRILGLPLTATEREIAKQINTLATYAEMGKTKSLASDFPFLTPVDRTPYAIEEAKKQIEQSESKLLYSLFWFWKNNSADELALEVLKEGNTSKAIAIWEKSVFASKNKIYKPIVLVENLIRQSTNWSEQKDEDHSLTKDEDQYIIERKKETSYTIPTVNTELNYDDNWLIDCDTEWLAGVDNIGYGIVFGRNGSSFFTFQISGNGQFTYGKFIDWGYTKILDWEENDAINKWSDNHIQIKKLDDKISFFINGVLINSVQAEPFFGKSFGFKVTNNQKISFRNFKFSKLVEHEIYGEGINVSSKNFSNIKNLSTLYLSLATNNGTLQLDYFNKGIALAKNFFSTDNIEDYSKLIAGERYIYNSEKTLHFYINDVIDSLKNYLEKAGGISTSQLINSFSTFPVEAKQFLNNRFVAKQIQNIDKEIETAQAERKKSAATAADTGKKLVTNTKSDIAFLKKVLGENDFQYQIIGDKLSSAIVQCGIDSFNNCKDADGEIDYPNAIKSEEGYLHEYEYALQVAVTERGKERAKENLDSCKRWIENKVYYNCWFCESGTPEEASKFEITIYKETSRDYQGVKYQYVPVEIQRCSKCKSFHQYDFNFESVSGQTFGIGVVGLLFGIAIDIVVYIFGNAYSLIGKTISKMLNSSKANIKDTSHSTIQNYPAIKDRFKQGWQFDKPKA